ncbi:GDSL esterase/lipase At1g28580 [Linum grandiflorum]
MGIKMGMLSCLFLLLILHPLSASDLKACKFQAIYSFGDSLSDTGNAKIEFPNPHAWIYPMGMTIGQATGRFCDGWLLLDRIAEAAGLPYTNPYLNKTLDHSKGVNFAVGGTGILSKELRRRWNVTLPYSNSSLDVQLRWFDQFLFQAFKNDTALLRQNLKASLFVIGGGGNDYAHLADAKGISSIVKQKQRIMPDIMTLMREAIEVL